MGVVFDVWDRELKRHLAMKLLLNGTRADHASVVGRFLGEAQVTGQLDHPGVVPVHELGLDPEGRVYFTMKLVEGETLKEIMGKVRACEDGWSMVRALDVMKKVCQAMFYAHSKGVVHRDLKPSNIMVGRFGEVYVMDWGLARVLGEEDPKDIRIRPMVSQAPLTTERTRAAHGDRGSPIVTMDGHIVGTPAYMSPEQARGEIDRLGPHSDVYALGAMIYHLLAGYAPHCGPDASAEYHAVLKRVQKDAHAPLAKVAPGLPPELMAICEKSMARETPRRYSSMDGLIMDLEAYLDGRVVQAYETGVLAELRKWIGRNKVLVSAIAVAAVLAIIVITISFQAMRREHAARSQIRLRDILLEYAFADLDVGQLPPRDQELLADNPGIRDCMLLGDFPRAGELLKQTRGGVAAIGELCLSAPRAHIVDPTPTFAFVASSVPREASSFQLRIIDGASYEITRTSPLLKPSSEDLSSVEWTLPDSDGLAFGQYFWQVGVVGPRGPEWDGQLVYFAVRPPLDRSSKLLSLSATGDADLDAVLRAILLARAGFSMDAKEILESFPTAMPPRLASLSSLARSYASLQAGDLASALESLELARSQYSNHESTLDGRQGEREEGRRSH